MSLAGSDGRVGRACGVCAPGFSDIPGPVLGLAGGFGLTVLSQALLLGSLPLAGALVAPSPSLTGVLPAALLAGAAVGAWPAGILARRLGAMHALGAGALSGSAGGALLAHALLNGSFAGAVVGAVLLGAAQGAGALYRHVGFARGGGYGAPALVFGAGVAAGFAGPGLAGLAEAAWSPHLVVGTVLVATLAHLAALALCIALPAPSAPTAARRLAPARRAALGAVLLPTLAAALAWGIMTAMMVAAPLAMAACGIAPAGVGGAIAWHVVAMYLPALAAAPALSRLGPEAVAGFGLALIALAAAVFAAAGSAPAFSAALFTLGVGWGLVTLAAGAWLHRSLPTSGQIALHDAVLFASALTGAVAAPVLAG